LSEPPSIAEVQGLIATVQDALPQVEVLGPPSRMPKGFSSESWRVTTTIGDLVVKVRRRSTDMAKLRGQAEAARLARLAGLPTAEVLHVGIAAALGDRPVVIFRFIPGIDAEEALPGLEQPQRISFFSDLGDMIGRLHGIGLPHFTERIGSPGAAVSDWYTVVQRTTERAAAWNRERGMLTLPEIAAFYDRLLRDTATISAVVKPALTHRDLYLANVLIADGHLTAIIDFELAKGYDPLLDFVKLGMFVFERWPDGIEPFMAAYRSRVGHIVSAEERVSVCFALEQFVMLPNWVNLGEARLAKVSCDFLRDWLRGEYPWWLRGRFITASPPVGVPRIALDNGL